MFGTRQPMTENANQTDPMFPVLNEAQIAHLVRVGCTRRARQDEILFDQGDDHHGVFIVVSGSIEVAGVSSSSETALKVLGPGAFTGEVNQLSGRRSLVRCRAIEESVLVELPRPSLRQVMQTEATL